MIDWIRVSREVCEYCAARGIVVGMEIQSKYQEVVDRQLSEKNLRPEEICAQARDYANKIGPLALEEELAFQAGAIWAEDKRGNTHG
jgi:hypothetical protein